MSAAAAPLDVPALKALWREVFGDDISDIDRFFETFYAPDLTAAILEDGTPVAAAYAVPSGALVLSDGRRIGSAMIYAVATSPACRGRGYGAAVTEAASELARRAGCPAVVLKPADSGLFEFYEKHTGFRPFFEAYAAELTRGQLTAAPALTACPVPPSDYRRLRNGLLAGSVFIDMDERGLRYQKALFEASGGSLCAVSDIRDGRICACAFTEMDGDTLFVKELLLADGCRPLDAVSALAALQPACSFRIRAPKRLPGIPGATKTRFGMILPIEGVEIPAGDHSATWYGPAFD